ncbi:hypothetical protein TELCIR_22039 [Teladorsagia circumcincta]|uniref:Uncharacterized protein n=1 Tax=Teladorsagia circumcincta TaxID=45464 RepID=A0A2G9TF32_TELCI|nr:hypothetical protein TELCIR_22039 [Teladorsagia circumcincta]
MLYNSGLILLVVIFLFPTHEAYPFPFPYYPMMGEGGLMMERPIPPGPPGPPMGPPGPPPGPPGPPMGPDPMVEPQMGPPPINFKMNWKEKRLVVCLELWSEHSDEVLEEFRSTFDAHLIEKA